MYIEKVHHIKGTLGKSIQKMYIWKVNYGKGYILATVVGLVAVAHGMTIYVWTIEQHSKATRGYNHPIPGYFDISGKTNRQNLSGPVTVPLNISAYDITKKSIDPQSAQRRRKDGKYVFGDRNKDIQQLSDSPVNFQWLTTREWRVYIPCNVLALARQVTRDLLSHETANAFPLGPVAASPHIYHFPKPIHLAKTKHSPAGHHEKDIETSM